MLVGKMVRNLMAQDTSVVRFHSVTALDQIGFDSNQWVISNWICLLGSGCSLYATVLFCQILELVTIWTIERDRVKKESMTFKITNHFKVRSYLASLFQLMDIMSQSMRFEVLQPKMNEEKHYPQSRKVSVSHAACRTGHVACVN